MPHTIRGELRHLIALRDSARRLLALEAGTIEDTPLSLEVLDEETGQAHPAGILRERQIARRVAVRGVETPSEALAVCLDTHGTVELETIAQLLGIETATARAELGELVYDHPATGELVPAAQYLSGNVRVKLDQAREMVATRPELAVNVTALEAAVPAAVGAEEEIPRMGASWINATPTRSSCASCSRTAIRVSSTAAAARGG